jgi:hypothetical protein
MTQLAGWLSSNTAALSIFGAAVAFIWSTTQQIAQRKAEAREREFRSFHNLVRDLVSPDTADGVMRLDRQAAVVFELRPLSSLLRIHRTYAGGSEESVGESPLA